MGGRLCVGLFLHFMQGNLIRVPGIKFRRAMGATEIHIHDEGLGIDKFIDALHARGFKFEAFHLHDKIECGRVFGIIRFVSHGHGDAFRSEIFSPNRFPSGGKGDVAFLVKGHHADLTIAFPFPFAFQGLGKGGLCRSGQQ